MRFTVTKSELMKILTPAMGSVSNKNTITAIEGVLLETLEDGTVRPVFLYTVDADEFVVNKLLDRGSLAATTIVTNVQDFIAIIANGLKLDWKQYSKQK